MSTMHERRLYERRSDSLTSMRITIAISLQERQREFALAYLLRSGIKADIICRVLAEPRNRRH